jgi:hypothetical protein
MVVAELQTTNGRGNSKEGVSAIGYERRGANIWVADGFKVKALVNK